MLPHQPSSTLFPYTTLFRSARAAVAQEHLGLAQERRQPGDRLAGADVGLVLHHDRGVQQRIDLAVDGGHHVRVAVARDRKSTRLNSSHVEISYAVFCLKKKK